MTQTELAVELADAVNESRRLFLIRSNQDLADTLLARSLKEICLESWTTNPTRAVCAAESLTTLLSVAPSPETAALAAWTDGVASMVKGQLRRAVIRFDNARGQFQKLDQSHSAASTQVAKLYPLAMLGRYDEAIETGLWARQIFFDCADLRSAGRIEHNLGNIYQMSDRYVEAEDILRAARGRFIELGDIKTQAQITNSLAYVLSYRYKFAEAEQLYSEAFELADQADLIVTKAEIESNIGFFSLSQGRYDRALNYLERARASYAKLGMPHQSAIAELEMADVYLELNLHGEAAAIYSRVIPLFAETGMSIEHGRALTNFARVQFVSGETTVAHSLMSEARNIFASCRSSVGEANVLLGQAQFLFNENKYEETLEVLREAELPLSAAGIKGAELSSDFLRAESWRMQGRLSEARTLLEEIRAECETHRVPLLSARCLTSLGLTARADGDKEASEKHFKLAVAMVETLREPLPSEDFRTAFFGDKLTPYRELARLCLEDEKRVAEAFEYFEKSRSRTLIEMIGETSPEPKITPERDGLQKKISNLRGELNWLYNQIHQPTRKNSSRTIREIEVLNKNSSEREAEIAELSRQLHLCSPQKYAFNSKPVNISELQASLAAETALIEFAEIDNQFLAIVVTSEGLRVFQNLCSETEIADRLSRLYFQVETLRNNPQAVETHFYELTLRTRRILSELYDLLLLPLEKHVGLRNLVIAPHGSLYYVPFHALYDGFAHVIENREVVYTPSAAVLQSCLEKPRRRLKTALFAGVSDERIPMVSTEIRELSGVLPGDSLLDDDATQAAIIEHSAGKDILHLACHAQFRTANPLFSSLKLADGWLTVRDLYSIKFNADLVVLSACDTALSRVAPGDELLGLARGFFSAGATSLVLSLWTVDDATTLDLMSKFYKEIAAGFAPAKALRLAQCQIMRTKPHPFFWAPFIAIGR